MWEAEYHEWHWLHSHFYWEKGGLPSRKEIKRIKAEAEACPIAVVKPAADEKRSSLPSQEVQVEEKPKTSSKGTKDEVARFEPVTPAMPKMASSIVDRIAQHKGSIVPPVPKPMPRRPLGAKSSSLLKRLANMKSDKVDYAAKVTLRPASLLLRLIHLMGRRRLLE
ncbi:hypothetical protein EV2_045345 [Malus domestica]